MFENRNIQLVGTPYNSDQLDAILRNGLGASVLTSQTKASASTIIQIPVRLNGTLNPQCVEQLPEGCIAITTTIISIESSWTTAQKIVNCITQIKKAPISVIVVPFQLAASGHFCALFLARREKDKTLSLGLFNPEGQMPHELNSTISVRARERYEEFRTCTKAAVLAVGTSHCSFSRAILQDPRNDEDKSCGPRVVAFAAHVLTNPKTVCSSKFDMSTFTRPMGGWNEIVMRDLQAFASEGDKGRLMHLHWLGGPDYPGERARLYQKIPTT